MSKYTSDERKEYATVENNGKPAFPIGDKEHARAALQDLPKAKGLSEGQKEKIKAKARKMLYGKDAVAMALEKTK